MGTSEYVVRFRACAAVILAAVVASSRCHAQCELNAVYSTDVDALNDQFGFSVSISDDFAIIGAFRDTPVDPSPPPPVIAEAGAAYFARRIGANWVVQQKITPPIRHELQWYGYAVDIDGDYAVVGAPRNESFGLGAAGAVFVYKRSGLSWNLYQTLTASDFAGNDWFGVSVSIRGDRIIVGSFLDDDAGSESGSAYVFRLIGGTWQEEGKLTASNAVAGDHYGIDVDVSGDSAIVGADRRAAPNSPGFQHGAAYIYEWNGSAWIEKTMLQDQSQPATSFLSFGATVAINGNDVLIGAPQILGGGGAVHFYQRGPVNWQFLEKATPTVLDGNDAFGIAVDLSGDYAVIGSQFRDHVVGGIPYNDAGAAYVFKRYGMDWQESFLLRANDIGTSDQMGTAVAISGDRVIAGSSRDDVNGVFDAGSAHVFAAAGPECPGDRFWYQPVSGDFDTPSNWDPGIPGQLNEAFFDLPGKFTVDFSTNVRNLKLTLAAGDVTFDLHGREYSMTTTTDASIAIGELAGENATLRVFDGTLKGVYGEIGGEPASVGSIFIDGATSRWVTDQTLCVGCGGNGSMLASSGAQVSTRYATIGLSAGSLGSAELIGSNTNWYIASALTIANGSLAIDDGALLAFGVAGSGITILGNGKLTGNSTVDGRVINYGQVSPGPLSGVGAVGSLMVGDYIQAAQDALLGPSSGRLNIDLDATGSTITADQLVVDGTAILGGGLIVSRSGKTEPAINDYFDILVANSIASGTRFDVALLPGLAGDKYLRVVVPQEGFLGTQVVSLEVRPLDELVNLAGTEPVSINGGPVDALVADFDHINGLDLAVVVSGNTDNDPGSVFILLNNGNGELDFATSQTAVGRAPSAVTSADFNGDGWVDLAVTNKADNTVSILLNSANGSGVVLPDIAPFAVGESPIDVAAANTGGTTAPDLIVVNSIDNSVTEYRNSGAGAFALNGILFTNVFPTSVDPADVDNDRDTDILVSMIGGGGNGTNGAMMLFLNQGEAGFSLPQQFQVGVNPSQITATDLNNDQFVDIVVTNSGDETATGGVSVIINLAGALQPAVDLPVGDTESIQQPGSTTAVDLEPDGDTDIVFVVTEGSIDTVRVLRNDLDNQQLAFAQATDLPTANPGTQLVLNGDLDGQNGPDLITVVVTQTSDSPLSVGDPIAAAQVFLNTTASTPTCPGDISPPPLGNGVVNVNDLLAVIGAWGPCAGCPADVAPEGGDGAVNVNDLLTIIGDWGPCP